MAFPSWSWSLSQRRALIALVGVAWLALVIRAMQLPTYVSDPPPETAVPPTLIDPNTAPAAVIETIPGIGPARADALIAYRDDFVSRHPGALAFRQADDLMMVKGIGPATMEKMEPYLIFEPPATKPGK
ncbi:MAG TPA: helix-hairpin-helix domain-containing protein [Tepidisphaeraceae bacterium]|nr:helix-hairpin-helix domain-containing protein [Tepidisphaeraceae bacterium]